MEIGQNIQNRLLYLITKMIFIALWTKYFDWTYHSELVEIKRQLDNFEKGNMYG